MAPLLARAWVASGQPRNAITRYASLRLSDASADADLQAALALAYGREGQDAASRDAVKAALERKPDHAAALTMQARQTAGDGDIDAALAQLQRLTAAHPGELPALLLRGQMLWFGKQDAAGALASFRQALQGDERYVPAYVGIAAVLTQQGDVEALKAHAASMKKALPQHPETRFLEAQIAFINTDYRGTRELLAPLLTQWPRTRRGCCSRRG
ncbi:MAG: hypothetical protein MZW92_21130 [Comamonadaceae bacterium]|nr:hypothetical protein [Comamonadaceae bacterium]